MKITIDIADPNEVNTILRSTGIVPMRQLADAIEKASRPRQYMCRNCEKPDSEASRTGDLSTCCWCPVVAVGR